MKPGVRLDAGHDADVVGLRGEAVEHHRIAFVRGPQGDHVHRGADGGADGFLGDAVAFEDAALALGRAAAVAAHRRDQEGTGAEFFQEGGRFAQHERDVGDAAAAGRQRHRLSWADAAAEVHPFQGRGDGAGHVVDARPLEALTEADELRITHGRTPV